MSTATKNLETSTALAAHAVTARTLKDPEAQGEYLHGFYAWCRLEPMPTGDPHLLRRGPQPHPGPGRLGQQEPGPGEGRGPLPGPGLRPLHRNLTNQGPRRTSGAAPP